MDYLKFSKLPNEYDLRIKIAESEHRWHLAIHEEWVRNRRAIEALDLAHQKEEFAIIMHYLTTQYKKNEE